MSGIRWGEDPAITFLHGGALNARSWDEVILSLGRPAWALDLPGHGESDWRHDYDYAPRSNAAAVAAFLDQEAHGRPQVLVGQSLGGATTMALLDIRPDLVKAVVLVDITPGLVPAETTESRPGGDGPPEFESREQLVDLAIAAGVSTPRPVLERRIALNTCVREDGRVLYSHHFAHPVVSEIALRMDFSDLWKSLEQATVPVLLVRGSRGYVSKRMLSEFRRRVPQAAVAEVDAGHNVQHQRPVDLAGLIASHFHEGSISR